MMSENYRKKPDDCEYLPRSLGKSHWILVLRDAGFGTRPQGIICLAQYLLSFIHTQLEMKLSMKRDENGKKKRFVVIPLEAHPSAVDHRLILR